MYYPMAMLLGEKEDDNMYKPTYEQVIQYAKDYTYVPICREILADLPWTAPSLRLGHRLRVLQTLMA